MPVSLAGLKNDDISHRKTLVSFGGIYHLLSDFSHEYDHDDPESIRIMMAISKTLFLEKLNRLENPCLPVQIHFEFVRVSHFSLIIPRNFGGENFVDKRFPATKLTCS